MNFYHLTADIHPSSSEDEEVEDDPNWLVIKASQVSAKKVNDDQVEVQRQIDEIFEALSPSHSEVRPVVRRRLAKAKCSRHRRTLNTMSGYFSDWAKWLTEAHPSWKGAGRDAEMSLQQASRNG